MATFDFAFDPRFAAMVRLAAGATAANSSVHVGDGRLLVDFGWFGIDTPLANVRDVTVTRDYRWFRAIGPRLSMSDHGATYGSNVDGGVCVCFVEPVRALPVVASPGLTMTVADLDGLAEAVRTAIG